MSTCPSDAIRAINREVQEDFQTDISDSGFNSPRLHFKGAPGFDGVLRVNSLIEQKTNANKIVSFSRQTVLATV